jgi:hypothetical protein
MVLEHVQQRRLDMKEVDKMRLLEKQVARLAAAINGLQSRVDFLENFTNRQASVETLSFGTAQVGSSVPKNPVGDVDRIPESMKRTLRTVSKNPRKGVTSEEVAKITGRSKNLESGYLHKLFEAHRLTRKRVGRNVYYSVYDLRKLPSEE